MVCNGKYVNQKIFFFLLFKFCFFEYSCVMDQNRRRSIAFNATTINSSSLLHENDNVDEDDQLIDHQRKRAVTSLQVKIGSKWLACPANGGVLKVKTSEYNVCLYVFLK